MFNSSAALRGESSCGVYRKPLLLDKLSQKQVRDYMPSEDVTAGLVEFFAALGDATRLKIVSALSITSMCVTDLATMLGMNQTTVSHQLRYLKTVGAVACRRQGKIIFYGLADERLNDVMLAGVEFLGYQE